MFRSNQLHSNLMASRPTAVLGYAAKKVAPVQVVPPSPPPEEAKEPETFYIADWIIGTSMTEKNPGRRFAKSKTIPNFFFWIDEWEEKQADIVYNYKRAQESFERQKQAGLQEFLATHGIQQ